jgi:hypothetical protein
MVDRERVATMLESVELGEEVASWIYVCLKEELDFLQDCLDELKPQVMEEVRNFPATHGALRVEYMPGTRRYSFEHLDDWKVLKGQMAHLEGQAKMAYSAYEKGRTLVNDETGEIVPLPYVTYTKDTVKVTVRK